MNVGGAASSQAFSPHAHKQPPFFGRKRRVKRVIPACPLANT